MDGQVGDEWAVGLGAGGDGTQCAFGGRRSGRFTQMRPRPQKISTNLMIQWLRFIWLLVIGLR